MTKSSPSEFDSETQADADLPERHVHRICTLCEAGCGITVSVCGRTVIRVEGDHEDTFSNGHICPKAHGLLELHQDPDRLRGPLRRTGNGFEPIEWEEALALCAERLGAIREAHGADAIALYRGNPTVHDVESLLYWNVLQSAVGTRNQYSAGSVDTWPRWVQAGLTYGGFLRTPVPDLERCEYLLMLGANPLASNGSLMTAPGIKKRLEAIRARGGRLVVVDPRRSETADVADEHVFVRPGGDSALVLGMVHCLFDEERVALGAAAEHVAGLDTVRALAAKLTPEYVSPLCGVEPETIRRIAREFAEANAAVCYGRMGTSVQRYGTLATWAIDLLNILTGNLDRPGGVLFPEPAAPLDLVAGPTQGEVHFGRYQSRVGGHDEILGEFPLAAFAEEIETPGEGQIRALAIIAGNPVASAPNAARIDAALESLDFMVAFDFYLNETTRHADLILPPTMTLEHAGYDVALLHFAVRNVAKWSPRVLEPGPGERPISEMLLDVSKRLMGLGALSNAQVDDLALGQFVQLGLDRSGLAARVSAEDVIAALGKEPGVERIVDLLIRLGPYGDGFGQRPDGLTLADVQAHPHGLDLGPLSPSLPKYIATPSGRIELAPERIVADLPRLEAEIEAAHADPATLKLDLIGRRDLRSMNSWLHNLPSLAKGKPRCTLQVCAADAARLGLADGGRAEIESPVGRLTAPVEISDRIGPGVVSLPHGWGHDMPGMALSVAGARPGVNANLVVDDTELDVPSGTSVLNGLAVEVRAVT